MKLPFGVATFYTRMEGRILKICGCYTRQSSCLIIVYNCLAQQVDKIGKRKLWSDFIRPGKYTLNLYDFNIFNFGFFFKEYLGLRRCWFFLSLHIWCMDVNFTGYPGITGFSIYGIVCSGFMVEIKRLY